MDLKNGKITIGEMERNPKVAALLDQMFPGIRNHPLAPMIRLMTLNQAISFARSRGAKQEQIEWGLKMLRAL